MIGVTVTERFVPGSTVSLHRAYGNVYDEAMLGPVVTSAEVDSDGSVLVQGLKGGEAFFVVGAGLEGQRVGVKVTAKDVQAPRETKAKLASSTPSQEPPAVVTGARTTVSARPKPKASPRKPQKAKSASKPAAKAKSAKK